MIFFSNWIVFFPLAFSLFVGLRLAAGSRDEVQRSTPTLILRLIMFLFFFLAFLSVGLRSSPLSLVWVFIILALSVVLIFKNRRLEKSAMLHTLLNARTHRQRQMLADAFFNANLGYVRRRARVLCWEFERSLNWGASLEVCRIATSMYERLGVRLMARYGLQDRVEGAYDIEPQEPLVIEQEMERTLGRLAMFSWVILLFPLFAFYMRMIVPTFQSMLAEMEVNVPPAMELVISVSNDFSLFGWSSLFSFVPLAVLLVMGIGVLLWLFPHITRWPLVRVLFRDYYRVVGFVAFRDACDRETNLTQACLTTAELIPVDFIAKRYQLAASLLDQGQLPSSAFRNAGILNRREAATLAWGLDSSNPVWGLQQLAAWKIERMLRRVSTVVQWMIVGLTLLMGSVVGIFAASVIQTLSLMILEL